jgi:hypothetical protein
VSSIKSTKTHTEFTFDGAGRITTIRITTERGEETLSRTEGKSLYEKVGDRPDLWKSLARTTDSDARGRGEIIHGSLGPNVARAMIALRGDKRGDILEFHYRIGGLYTGFKVEPIRIDLKKGYWYILAMVVTESHENFGDIVAIKYLTDLAILDGHPVSGVIRIL